MDRRRSDPSLRDIRGARCSDLTMGSLTPLLTVTALRFEWPFGVVDGDEDAIAALGVFDGESIGGSSSIFNPSYFEPLWSFRGEINSFFEMEAMGSSESTAAPFRSRSRASVELLRLDRSTLKMTS